MAFQILEQPASAPALTLARDDDTPAKIGKYRILGPLGEGGMSVVYRARDEALDRLVALKVLHRHLARDPEARARFTREARAVARLTHKNIPEVYDFSGSGSDDAAAHNYIVSELVDGASLAKLLRPDTSTPPMLPELGVAILLGVGQALAHAHKHQVVHRDVKPENVLVGKDGVAKLTDFGIAQVRGLESMTMTGTLIGSPAHMAPEQVDGTRDLDARVDVWGFGTALYMVATGKLPFEADNAHHLLRKVVAGDYPDPRRASPHVDAELAGIIRKCLIVDRAQRYPDMDTLLGELRRWYEGRRLAAPKVEIQGYMADPAGYMTLLHERLVTTDLRLGDEALAKGQTAAALDRFGRVLALDPDSDVALERIGSIEKRRRHRKLMLVGAAAFAVVGASTAVALVLAQPTLVTLPARARALMPAVSLEMHNQVVLPPKPTPDDVVPPAVVEGPWGEQVGSALATVTIPRHAKVDRIPKDPRDPKDPKDPRDKPLPVRQLVSLTVSVDPAPVKLTIDGTRVTTPAAFAFERDRAYNILLEHPCDGCRPDKRTYRVPLTAREGDGANFAFKGWKPATLTLKCSREAVIKDNFGRPWACNQTHSVPVDKRQAVDFQLFATTDEGQPIGSSTGLALFPGADIKWQL